MRLAGYLMMNGFVLLDVEPHKFIKDKRVFIFKNSKELEQKIKNYKKLKEVGKMPTSF